MIVTESMQSLAISIQSVAENIRSFIWKYTIFSDLDISYEKNRNYTIIRV